MISRKMWWFQASSGFQDALFGGRCYDAEANGWWGCTGAVLSLDQPMFPVWGSQLAWNTYPIQNTAIKSHNLKLSIKSTSHALCVPQDGARGVLVVCSRPCGHFTGQLAIIRVIEPVPRSDPSPLIKMAVWVVRVEGIYPARVCKLI